MSQWMDDKFGSTRKVIPVSLFLLELFFVCLVELRKLGKITFWGDDVS